MGSGRNAKATKLCRRIGLNCRVYKLNSYERATLETQNRPNPGPVHGLPPPNTPAPLPHASPRTDGQISLMPAPRNCANQASRLLSESSAQLAHAPTRYAPLPHSATPFHHPPAIVARGFATITWQSARGDPLTLPLTHCCFPCSSTSALATSLKRDGCRISKSGEAPGICFDWR